jgi:hypothetical protein
MGSTTLTARAWLDLARGATTLLLWRGRGALATRAARLSLWLRPDATLREAREVRAVLLNVSDARHESIAHVPIHTLADTPTRPLPTVPTAPATPARRADGAASIPATFPPTIPEAPSSTRQRRPRRAAPTSSASPTHPTALGGVSAFARALGRDERPLYPNVRALIIALCDAAQAIEREEGDWRARVASNLAAAALQLPHDVDAALFELLPTPPLGAASDSPDLPSWLRPAQTYLDEFASYERERQREARDDDSASSGPHTTGAA